MFQNKGLENLNCARLILGNADIPSSGSGTIDIKSSNPNYPITINGVLPGAVSIPGKITNVDIKGGLTSIGKINSISGLTVTSGGLFESGMTGTIPHSILSSGDIAQFRIDSLVGGITGFNTTPLPITPSAGSVEFIQGVEYDGLGLDGSGCKCTFIVTGGIIQSVTIVTGGGGYTNLNLCNFISNIDPLTQRTFSLQITSIAAAEVIAITDPGYGYNNGESLGFIIPNGLLPDIVGTITTKTLVADFSGSGYTTGTFFLIENLNNATMIVTKVDLTGAIRAFTVGVGGSGYTVGDVTLNTLPPVATLPTPATFSITSVESGGGGGSYTDAQAITALTNSTSPYVVNQTMNGNLSVATGLTVIAGGANIGGQLDATEAMIDNDLAVTTGNLYIDAGDITVSVGDLQLQTGNLLNIPSSTVLADAQFTATWTANADGSYTLKRHTLATPTTEPYLLLDSPTRQEVLSQTFFNNAEGLEVRNKVELVDTNNPGGFAKIELDHVAPADNVNIPIHHFSIVKSGEATGVPQMALSSDLLMIRDGDVLVDDVTHTPLETRGKPPNKFLGYNTTSGEISYINNSIELQQPFVGSGDPVPVGGVNRGAIADTENISSATITGTYKYYNADKFQVMIISYGSKFKVVFSGELLMGDTYAANDTTKAIQWDTDLAYYFGDPTATQQINAGVAGSKTYGPRTSVFLPMTRRIGTGASAGSYEIIAVEIHDQVAGTGTGNNYFMRFNKDLEIGDRLLFDGVEYWTESTA